MHRFSRWRSSLLSDAVNEVRLLTLSIGAPGGGGIEGGGSSIEGIGPRGTAVDHAPGKAFAVGFLVENRSGRPVTIKRITGTDSGRRLRASHRRRSLAPYTARHCTGLCAPPPGVLGGRPYRELPPLPPLTLQPGTTAGVTLHFRGAACGAAPHSVKEVDNRVLRVDYEADGSDRNPNAKNRRSALGRRLERVCSIMNADRSYNVEHTRRRTRRPVMLSSTRSWPAGPEESSGHLPDAEASLD